MEWTGHVARVGGDVLAGCWWGKRERDRFEDPDVDWTILLKGIFKK
jgi:hypothetical protein